MRKARTSVALLILLSGATACEEPIAPDASPEALALRSQSEALSPRELGSTDDFFLRVHDLVPGFAGLMLDDGVPTVYLVHADRGEQARSVLTPLLVERGWNERGFVVREATHSWRELYGWRVEARALLSKEEMRSLGISVSRNRLRVGIARNAAPDRVAARLAELGVPADAVEIEEVDPVPTLADLADRRRPVMGGLKIVDGQDGMECTAGFDVLWQDTLRTMLTAAHCVGPVGSVGPKTVWQPEYSPTNNRIGIESLNPSMFSCSAAGGQPRCRNSDAALVIYDDSVSWSFGHVARTLWAGQYSGSTGIDPLQSRLWIVDSYYSAFEGDTLHKIGWRTGWTTGVVSENTCDDLVTSSPSTGQYVLLCQTEVDAGAQGGDSGSPVFRMGSNGQIHLAGVLWGGFATGPFHFSSMNQIEMDFSGYIDVITDAPTLPSGLSITGPTEIQPEATCLWQGNVTAGTAPLSYSWTIDGGSTVSTTDSFIGGKPPESLLSSFVLRFTVTNDAGTQYVQITVTEDENAEMCLM
jgi:hypothetical protein